MSWIDDAVALEVAISTAGDFLEVGTRTEYPFTSGGPGGVPYGWLEYYSGGVAADVSMSVGEGRFNISNLGADAHAGKWYGAIKDFTGRIGYRYHPFVRARTMDGKGSADRNVEWGTPASMSTYMSQRRRSQTDWEDVAVYNTNFLNLQTTMRVTLAAWYSRASGATADDPTWGIQFTDFSILEVPETAPVITWKDVLCDVQGLALKMGRERKTSRYEVASCQLTVLNNDGDFTYQQNHPWGLRPGRFLRVRWDSPFTNMAGLFFGLIDSLIDGYTLDGRAATTISCVDLSSLLSNMEVPSVGQYNTNLLGGARFSTLVEGIGWHPSYTAKPDGNGAFVMQPIFANGRTVRDEAGLIADSEGGAVYSSVDGQLTYRTRQYYQDTQTPVVLELLAQPHSEGQALPKVDNAPYAAGLIPVVCLNEIQTSWSRDRIVNTVSVANQGGSAYTLTDQTSRKKYGPYEYSRMDLLNADSAYSPIRAQDILKNNAEAVLRVNSVSFRPTPGVTYSYPMSSDGWLGRSKCYLNASVRVRYTHPTNLWGFSCVAKIQGIEDSVSVDDWVVKLAIDDQWDFNMWEHSVSGKGWDVAQWDLDNWDA